MDKIELTVQEISRGMTFRGIYILLLQEKDGRRKLPIMLGMADAHALLRKVGKDGAIRPRNVWMHIGKAPQQTRRKVGERA